MVICQRCGECCKCMVFPVHKPLQKSVLENWLDVRGCDIVKETPSALWVKVNQSCPHLVKSNKIYACNIYSQRPQGCRDFDGRNYEWLDCALKKSKYVVLEK